MFKKFPIEVQRHSAAHLMATAISELYPDAKFGVGPVIENGFFYDVETQQPLTLDDFEKIETKMRELQSRDIVFERKEMPLDAAIKKFQGLQQPYKIELLNDLKKYGTTKLDEQEREGIMNINTVSAYQSGLFFDLCRGPHVDSAKQIGAFKLHKLSGAYWRGSEKNKMLQRIYGLCFETQKELDEYLTMIKEAEKRDHRVLGEQLGIFMISEYVGKGLPLWLPKGSLLRKIIEDYMYEKEKRAGYTYVYTPHLTKRNLYERSGHLAHYKDSMYAPIIIEDEEYYLKPMNCPHHHMIYAHTLKSYRDLPLRLAEFGTVYRYERSGVLSGLMRVRGFTQNDSHIYCTAEQLESEILGVLALFKEVYNDFDISDYWFRLSLPDFNNAEKYGDIENKKLWEYSADRIRAALKQFGAPYQEVEGEAAFYGPKVDAQIKNVYGHEDTIATIQIDFYMPERFDLTYIDHDGEKKRPFIIHRAILGSFDRFIAFLIEKTAGTFPLWCAPVQVYFAPVGKEWIETARELAKEFEQNSIRTEVDSTNETIGYKVRKAEQQKMPYIIVIGEKEAKGGELTVRIRGVKNMAKIERGKLIEFLCSKIHNKVKGLEL
ncbi:MAG: threonine--tRNA ligase [Parcubacteria group bacterium]|nr:threonine--tRNA ligase [Parcubacteria group bacterium]